MSDHHEGGCARRFTVNISKTFGCAFMLLSLAAFNNAANAQQPPYRSNCEDVKKILSGLHPVIESGPIWDCRAPDVATAMWDASLACGAVLGTGSPVAMPWPPWQILNWVDVFGIPVRLPDTYLGYCTGVVTAGVAGRSAVDQGKAAEAKKKIQDALDALGKK
jgi:hypothetical protein